MLKSIETTAPDNDPVTELRLAIEGGQLALHYMPLAAAADGRLCGFEALVPRTAA